MSQYDPTNRDIYNWSGMVDLAILVLALRAREPGPAGADGAAGAAGAAGVDANPFALGDVAFVSAAGADTDPAVDPGRGSLAKPFATVAAAAQYTMPKPTAADEFLAPKTIVVVSPGTYDVGTPIVLYAGMLNLILFPGVVLDADFEWALANGDRYGSTESPVFRVFGFEDARSPGTTFLTGKFEQTGGLGGANEAFYECKGVHRGDWGVTFNAAQAGGVTVIDSHITGLNGVYAVDARNMDLKLVNVQSHRPFISGGGVTISGGSLTGGGTRVESGTSITMEDCSLSGNLLASSGAITVTGGSVVGNLVSLAAGIVKVTNCSVVGNIAGALGVTVTGSRNHLVTGDLASAGDVVVNGITVTGDINSSAADVEISDAHVTGDVDAEETITLEGGWVRGNIHSANDSILVCGCDVTGDIEVHGGAKGFINAHGCEIIGDITVVPATHVRLTSVELTGNVFAQTSWVEMRGGKVDGNVTANVLRMLGTRVELNNAPIPLYTIPALSLFTDRSSNYWLQLAVVAGTNLVGMRVLVDDATV